MLKRFRNMVPAGVWRAMAGGLCMLFGALIFSTRSTVNAEGTSTGTYGLHEFHAETTILSSEVNDNFRWLGEHAEKYEGAISVDDAGHVGIGTTSPRANVNLQVEGSFETELALNAAEGNPDVTLAVNGNTRAQVIYNSDPPQLQFRIDDDFAEGIASISGAEKMVINDSGEVGIGTTFPEALLHLEGEAPNVMFTESDNSDYTWQLGGWNGGFLITDVTGWQKRLYINADGNVGIGTTNPKFPLEVTGNIAALGEGLNPRIFVGDDSDNALRISWHSELDMAWLQTVIGGQYAGDLLIQPDAGNVGIGTNPGSGYKLDVAGTIHADNVPESSDIRLKKDIEPLTGALERVLALQAVTYRWRDEKKDQDIQVGLIAQDVEPYFPEVVSSGANGLLSLEYGHLVAPVIEAVKEQQQLIDDQAATIEWQGR